VVALFWQVVRETTTAVARRPFFMLLHAGGASFVQ
jgi:hypothetical protein